MLETKDHNLAAFDVRKDPKKLAQAIIDYPRMVKTGPPQGAKNRSTDADRAAKRKPRFEAKKKAKESQ
jgi:hypothetical protein